MKYLTVIDGEGIVLSKVDNTTYKWAIDFNWRINKDGYVARKTHGSEIVLHRVVNNTPVGKITDHINRDKLDNRSRNLRTSDNRRNQCNQNLCRTNTSGFKGVWVGRSGVKPYRAGYQFKGKTYHIGSFSTAVEAAQAYDIAVSAIDKHYSTNKSLGLLR